MAKGFELVMLEEAKKFVLGLPQSPMKKVLYNAHRIASGEQNAELFKKLEALTFGSSELFTMAYNTACLPFGTRKMKRW